LTKDKTPNHIIRTMYFKYYIPYYIRAHTQTGGKIRHPSILYILYTVNSIYYIMYERTHRSKGRVSRKKPTQYISCTLGTLNIIYYIIHARTHRLEDRVSEKTRHLITLYTLYISNITYYVTYSRTPRSEGRVLRKRRHPITLVPFTARPKQPLRIC